MKHLPLLSSLGADPLMNAIAGTPACTELHIWLVKTSCDNPQVSLHWTSSRTTCLEINSHTTGSRVIAMSGICSRHWS